MALAFSDGFKAALLTMLNTSAARQVSFAAVFESKYAKELREVAPMLTFQAVMWLGVAIVVGLVVAVYAGLVLTSYSLEGRRYQPRLRFSEPARSGGRLLVWWGVKVVDFLVRSWHATAATLYDTSAEVMGWLIDNSSQDIRQKVRSRFL